MGSYEQASLAQQDNCPMRPGIVRPLRVDKRILSLVTSDEANLHLSGKYDADPPKVEINTRVEGKFHRAAAESNERCGHLRSFTLE
jgi:hypothetical protein